MQVDFMSKQKVSPIRMNEPFTCDLILHKFINMGVKHNNAGVQHTLFLHKAPLTPELILAQDTHVQISGYGFQYLIKNTNIIIGCLLLSPTVKTHVEPHQVYVGDRHKKESVVTPLFLAENIGVMYFLGKDSSILAVPTEIDSPLLIKVES